MIWIHFFILIIIHALRLFQIDLKSLVYYAFLIWRVGLQFQLSVGFLRDGAVVYVSLGDDVALIVLSSL